MLFFYYFLFLICSGSILGCGQPFNSSNFVRMIDQGQADATSHINKIANTFRTDNDPVYRQHQQEFVMADANLDLIIQKIQNIPTDEPELLCSEPTRDAIYTIWGINKQDSNKPLLINRPGLGLNACAFAKKAIFVDENFFQQNKDKYISLFYFLFRHEYFHTLKYQPDVSTLKNINFVELYLQKAKYFPIPLDQQITFYQFIETAQNALQVLNYCYEWGADLGAAKTLPHTFRKDAANYYRALNLPDCKTHPNSPLRANFIEQSQ